MTEGDQEVFLAIAQVAATFAGFAALAGVIGHYSPEAARHDFERLKTVVLVSLLVVVAALLPIVVVRFGADDALSWRLSSGIAFLLNLVVLVLVARAGHRSGLHAADKLFTWIGYTLEVPVQLVLISNVVGLFAPWASALYLFFLFLCVCQAVLAFMLLLTSLFRSTNDTSE